MIEKKKQITSEKYNKPLYQTTHFLQSENYFDISNIVEDALTFFSTPAKQREDFILVLKTN